MTLYVLMRIMKTIRRTQKLLDRLVVKKADLLDDVNSDRLLGEWYANILRISRHNWVLFTESETLYSFLVPNVRKADLK